MRLVPAATLAVSTLLYAAPAQAAVAPPAACATAGENQMVVDGVRLYYERGGPAAAGTPPVLFLHGGPGYNSYSFRALMGRRLERRLPMIYLDERGSGRSERPWDEAYSMGRMVEDVEQLRQCLGIPRLSLMGHSFGGALALEYAARYPEQVERVVLVDALSDAPKSVAVWADRFREWHPEVSIPPLSAEVPSAWSAVMKALESVDGQAFFNRLQFQDSTFRVRQDSVDAASGLRNTGQVGRGLGNELMEYRFQGHSRLRAPVLVIAGRYDHAVGMESMRELARRLPDARLSEYEASAHFPYLEEAARFEREVVGFLLGPTR